MKNRRIDGDYVGHRYERCHSGKDFAPDGCVVGVELEIAGDPISQSRVSSLGCAPLWYPCFTRTEMICTADAFCAISFETPHKVREDFRKDRYAKARPGARDGPSRAAAQK